jgi:ferrous iron transport protein A
MEFATDPSAPTDGARSLATLHKGDRGTVVRVLGDDAEVGDGTGATVVMRLIEIGFVPGERVEVVAEVRPGSDPIAVRVGGTCYALRRREVESILVELEADGNGRA